MPLFVQNKSKQEENGIDEAQLLRTRLLGKTFNILYGHKAKWAFWHALIYHIKYFDLRNLNSGKVKYFQKWIATSLLQLKLLYIANALWQRTNN